MGDYRLYLLDEKGHIRKRLDLDCETDDEAVAAVEAHEPGAAKELWEGARKVRVFPAKR